MSNLDLIANVSVDLSVPASEGNAYNKILIVGALPSVTPTVAPAAFGSYSTIKEVTEAGWLVGENGDAVGNAAAMAFSQIPRPEKIYIMPIQANKTVSETVSGAMEHGEWYCLCLAGVSSDQYNSVAGIVESSEKVFCFTDTAFTTSSIVGNDKNRSIGVVSENEFANVAFTARWLSFVSGSETAAFKVVSGIPAGEYTSTQIDNIKAANMNYIVSIGGRIVTMNGKTTSGEWCDVIRFRDWVKNEIQSRVSAAFVENGKLPYTDSGIAVIRSAIVSVLSEGRENGGIADDEYSGTNYIPGFTVSVPSASDVSSTDKQDRILRNVKFSARLSGAIHFAEIHGSLSYSG